MRRFGLALAIISGAWAPSIVVAAPPALSAGERQRLETVLTALDQGDWGRALSAVQGLPAPLPAAVEWWRLLEQDRPEPGFEELARFREQRRDWPRAARLEARVERAAVTASPAAVAAHFRQFPPQTAHGQWAVARALEALGDADTAATFARAAWRESAAFASEDEALFLGQFAAVLTPEDHRRRLDELAWRGLEAEAERTLTLVDDDFRRLIEARLWVRAGRAGVDARVNAVPAHLADDPGLLYERARFRRRAGDTAGAAAILLDPPPRIGEERRWWGERRIAIREAVDDEDFRRAYRLAAGHRQSGGAGFADAEWHAGWMALRFLERPADARAHFERMWEGVNTPISRGRAGYWAGRAAEADGDRAAAQDWYEAAAVYGITFYGQEAALQLGRNGFQFERSLPSADAAGLRASELGRLALLLGQVDDRLMLPVITNHLVRNGADAGEIGDAIALAQQLGRYDSAIAGYVPLYRAGAMSAAASHPVPRSYQGLLQPRDASVSPALALSIARQESRFVRTAVSPVGARGLMQIMPGTARLVAGQLGLGADIPRLTRDPDYNATLGTRYLGDLLRRFDDVALAAAGYNAGPGRPVQWIERLGDPRQLDRRAYIDWLERIPFGETRNYVQRIIEGERVYRTLLADG